MDAAEFDPLLQRAHALADAYLQSLGERHVGPRAGRDAMRAALHAPLPLRGDDPAAVLDLLAAQAERGMSACGSPR